ncbi:MAG: conserved membrane protein of unknown function [Promethearchaeota archaeon]|nr:MAG: conserved membrane protein of unknown function [Candidatus Lokiarchaeota archaeon]
MVKDSSEKREVSPLTSKLSMFFSAILMGNVGLFVTLLGSYSVFTIALLRGLFGTLFLSILLVFRKSLSRNFLKEVFQNHWKLLALIAVVNPLVILFYFMVIIISGYAIAAFLLYTGGIFLVIFLMLSGEEKVSKTNIICLCIALGGIAVIMEIWNVENISIGFLFGILSGFSLGALTFFKKKIYNIRRRDEEFLIIRGDFDIFLAWWGTLTLFLFFPIGGWDLLKLDLMDIFISLLLGLFPTALAFALYNVGLRNDKGADIVLLSYFEPVMATINTAIFLGELSPFTILGGSLILLANFAIQWFNSR